MTVTVVPGVKNPQQQSSIFDRSLNSRRRVSRSDCFTVSLTTRTVTPGYTWGRSPRSRSSPFFRRAFATSAAGAAECARKEMPRHRRKQRSPAYLRAGQREQRKRVSSARELEKRGALAEPAAQGVGGERSEQERQRGLRERERRDSDDETPGSN